MALGGVRIEYDGGDRVEKVGGGTRVRYDDRGGVREVGARDKFRVDARGNLREFVNDAHHVLYEYDHLGRLVAWREEEGKGGVEQFFYADPQHPYRLTHVHSPKSGLTQRLLYDPLTGFVVAIETGEQRILVATDHAGSPVLVLNGDGSVIKEMEYSPFGQVSEVEEALHENADITRPERWYIATQSLFPYPSP